jgi:hypothetical protein
MNTTIRNILTSPRWLGFAVSLTVFAVYLMTLAPSVNFIDSGELATVACTLGIAHPTGYPLFTLLGWFFTKLPLAAEPIARLNIMAAFFCAAGIFVFFQLVHFLLVQMPKGTSLTASLVASAGASLLLAFSETYWSQATSVEVYSLHLFFLSMTLYCFVRASLSKKQVKSDRAGSGESHWWMVFAFVLGLAFTNHMTTILLAPGLLYLYFAINGGGKDSWVRIVKMGAPFVLGLSVYLYLPLRAAHGALLNWGNPVTLERFYWHFSGKQFRVWLFSSSEAAGRQLKYFLDSLPLEFAYIGLLLGLMGAILLFFAHRKVGIATLILFVSCVLYSINYDIHDIDSYFLLAYLCIALWSGFAFARMATFLGGTPRSTTIAVILVLAIACAPVIVHYSKNDESSNYLVEDYTKNMFSSLQQDALVISYQWDFWVSASYYYQLVKGVRPDIAVVDKELLRRSWYLIQLGKRYPWLIGNSKGEVDAFGEELYKFEHDIPYNPAIIQAKYVNMISSFISRNMATRPVYVTPEIEAEFTVGFQRVPEGLAFRLVADTSFHAIGIPNYVVRRFARRGRLEDAVKNLYLSSLNAMAGYALAHGVSPDIAGLRRSGDDLIGKLGTSSTP